MKIIPGGDEKVRGPGGKEDKKILDAELRGNERG
tara:strand:+ start:5458 stop:5559 length:102 start_codon:yes stop_codon:yes gene_type:complete